MTGVDEVLREAPNLNCDQASWWRFPLDFHIQSLPHEEWEACKANLGFTIGTTSEAMDTIQDYPARSAALEQSKFGRCESSGTLGVEHIGHLRPSIRTICQGPAVAVER